MADFFRKFFLALLVFSFLAALSPNDAFSEDAHDRFQAPLTLTLEDSIATALLNNKDIQIQEQEVAVARANITAAQSRFFPQGSIGYSFTYNDATLTLTSLPPTKKDIGVFTGYKSDNQATLAGTQMIYDGGASIANLKQARVELKIQEETLRAKKLEIEFEAKRLYYGLLLAYETVRITQNLVDQAQAHYEDVRNKFEQGTSSKFDVLQSKVQVSLLIPELVRAKNAVESIADELKKLLYIKIQEDIEAAGRLSYMPIEIQENGFLDEAYSNNPQMHLKLLGVDLQKWGIEFAKSGYYPNINASANYLYRSNNVSNMVNYRHENWNIGVGGTVSIFDGMSTKAKVDEAKARYSQAILSKENITEQIAVDIRQGCLDLKQAHAIILSQKDNLEEAKEALKISYISYDNGVGINLDVIDSQVALSQVEKNLVAGIYDYLVAQAFLDRTMGREYFKEVKNDKKA